MNTIIGQILTKVKTEFPLFPSMRKLLNLNTGFNLRIDFNYMYYKPYHHHHQFSCADGHSFLSLIVVRASLSTLSLSELNDVVLIHQLLLDVFEIRCVNSKVFFHNWF